MGRPSDRIEKRKLVENPKKRTNCKSKKTLLFMELQRLKLVEISSDDGEHESDLDDDDKEDEDDEDCVILDGDPNKVSFEAVDLGDMFDGLAILDAKGQVACRDYPHSRDQCAKFPFDSTPHECHCDLCHCYACDSPAPCACWGCGTLDSDHCHATHNAASWKLVRSRVSMLKATPAPVNKSTEASSSASQSRHNLVSTTQSTKSNSSLHSTAQSVRNAKASLSTSQSRRNLAATTQSTDYAQPICNARGSASASQSRQVYKRRRPLEFNVGDHVFLKVSPRRGVSRFDKKGKLAPRFIGPFEILQRVGEVAYRLAIPSQLEDIHDVFHVSMLRKYEPDPSHVIAWDDVSIDRDNSYQEKPLRILDYKEQVLWSKVIPLVKVLWQHHGIEEATWESEQDMCSKYPELFLD